MRIASQGIGMSNDNNHKKMQASEPVGDINTAIHKDILDKLIRYAKDQLPANKAKLITGFIPHYFSVVPIEDLTSRSIADWYGLFMSQWEVMENRKSNECKIQVYNPHADRHGWQTTHTIIDVSYDDMPFLVDSIRVELNRLGFTTHFMINLGGIEVKRDKIGEIVDIFIANGKKKDHEPITQEAVIHMEIDRETDPKVLQDIKDNLLRVLSDVKLVVEDWEKMREQLFRALDELDQANIPIDKEEIEESKAFLRWLINDHFTFLGYRAYEVVGKDEEMALRLIPHTGLGVLRDESNSKVKRYFKELPPKARKLVMSPNILIISKTNTKATVHRYSYTDYIGVKRFDTHGKLIGERRFIGLYTSEAYNSNPQHIPFLRLKVETVLEKSGLPRTGHGARALRNILATLPRDDLFQASPDELFELAMGIYQMQERRKIRLFVRKDPYRRFFSCLVFVPRENFNTELLYKMRDILQQAFQGTEVTFTTHFSQSILARIHFVVRVDSKKPLTYDLKDIEKKLIEVGRSWKDDLGDNLLEYFGEEKGNELITRYIQAFPAGYRDTFSSQSAIYDIEHIERLHDDSNLEMSFYRKASESTLRFKLFHLNSTIPLSDALPMLENMGLRVLAEQSYEINLPNGQIVWVNDFTMTYPTNPELNVNEHRELFQDAFYHIWRADVENDSFNRLVLKAQLSAREIIVFRAYAKYFRQIGFTFSQQYIEETLVNNSSIAVLLMHLFKLRFDPKQSRSEATVTELEKTIKKALDTVANLDQDRIIRRYLEIILATLRTNYFQVDADGKSKSYLSFKFDPKQMPEMPLPLPMYEIFVYSPRFEGVHLRAGKVARGGIRWSDRREDFRTEVLGLMKAQQVKNAVIVPAGAKGGFVPKNLPADGNRDAIMQEAIACYKNFIRGLLDITDNYSGKEVLHPQDTVFYDSNDPYLVVAADKGTASFSDIANSIAKEYNFWLGDAFASGGSTGYDHKKMAITSRGVWESVKHHFQQLAIDLNNPFTVVGIGDMSGDVFGNGMLLSKNIKLIAAFNGDNIFVDPNPNSETSYAERQRLFNLPRSTWEDYNRELISKGGGVYKRSAKSIPVSPEIRAVLDLKKDNVEPNELIRAILKASVDLIWNGGIGTYVKNTQESNLEVGDRANDAIRINGVDSRFKVVGEGGNLGWTQLGRIEYALQGGKINTDFIDNSAGVDCSDHEVNIKILFNESVTKGKITEKQRNNLLVEMTEEVAKLVLHDNYRQVRTITLAVSQSLDYLSLYMRYIEDQERQGNINRQLEFLPDRKTLLERKANNKGLTRPEIAVLMAYSKIILKEEILKSGLADDPYLLKYMELAFPQRLSKTFSMEMQHHRLRKEIIATQLSNAIVNDMGIVFVYQMQDETGVSAAAVAQAYAIMREVFNIPWLRQAIDALDEKLAPSLQLETTEFEMMLEVAKLVRRAIRWLLKNRRPPYDIGAMIAEFSDSVSKLYQQLPQLLVGTEKESFDSNIKAFVAAHIPEEIAIKVASSRYIYSALNIIDIVKEHKVDIHQVAAIYFILAERLELVWFREKINSYPVDNRWSVLARSAFKDELDAQQRALTISVLQHKDKEKNVEVRINIWFEEHKPLIERWQSILTDLRSASAIDSSMLLVALHALSDLAEISIHDLHTRGE